MLGPRSIPRLLLLEAAIFALAALVHAGVLLHGYEHLRARIAETVIAVVLLAGWMAATARPEWARAAGLAAQGFAFLGLLAGFVAIVVGVGPRTAPDLVYHAAVLLLLAWGLDAIRRSPERGRVGA